MLFRDATLTDIKPIQIVRNSVKENMLSNPALVTDRDCADYIERRGKGWVAEENNRIVGFAIADLEDNNIWALFVTPEFESRGIGSQLHSLMLSWYFSQTREAVWLSTAPGTKAERFYRQRGWREAGSHGKGEIKFVMAHEDFLRVSV